MHLSSIRMHERRRVNSAVEPQAKEKMMKAKKQSDKRSHKSEKLRLNKETLKDLGAAKTEQIKGGAPPTLTARTGCNS